MPIIERLFHRARYHSTRSHVPPDLFHIDRYVMLRDIMLTGAHYAAMLNYFTSEEWRGAMR